jgi:hypothetical protein
MRVVFAGKEDDSKHAREYLRVGRAPGGRGPANEVFNLRCDAMLSAAVPRGQEALRFGSEKCACERPAASGQDRPVGGVKRSPPSCRSRHAVG